jgi:hypothetical protein
MLLGYTNILFINGGVMAGKSKIDIKNLDALIERYKGGESVADICKGTEINPATLRRRFLKAGVMRNVFSALNLAFVSGKMNGRKTRKGVLASEETKQLLREKALQRAQTRARGWRINSCGYAEFTRGELQNVLVHRFVVETHIGRKLSSSECVHHIDGNKLNNDISNLEIMTFAEHAKAHRIEEAELGLIRQRDAYGRFGKEKLCKNFS